MDFGKLKETFAAKVEEAKTMATNTLDNAKQKTADFKLEDITANLQSYAKDFSESDLAQKLTSIGKTAGATVVYPVFLLFNLLKSAEVTFKEKGIIVGTLGYFILPMDLIPDMIPVAGFTDDQAALLAALTAVTACITPQIIANSKEQLHTLLGDFDESALEVVNKALNRGNTFINKHK